MLTRSVAAFLMMVLLLVAFGCGDSVPQNYLITIDSQKTFQTITGWEATAQAGEAHSPAFNKYRDNLFELAVNDLGINRLRVELRCGAENPKDYFSAYRARDIDEQQWREHYYELINDNEDPFDANADGFSFSELDSTIENVVLPMKKKLEARGESLFINLNYIDFKDWRGRSNLRHYDNPEEYAEFILAAYLHLQSKYSIVPDAVEVILEPDTGTGWTGTHIGNAIVSTASRLTANNFKPAFIVPSTTNAANAAKVIDEIASVPGAMQFVTEFSYHRYRGVSDSSLREIRERAAKHGKKTAMLEWIGADFETVHEDIKVVQNSAWQQYTLAFPNEPDNGAQYFLVDDRDQTMPAVNLGKRTKFLRQYFRYIRANAKRVGAESSSTDMDPLAFINVNGKYVLVVKASVPGKISVLGLAAGNYGISYTTPVDSNVSQPDVSVSVQGSLEASIPGPGILTIYAK